MSRVFAAAWLGIVLLLGANLAWRIHQGLTFRTDLMALLPRDEANPALQRVNDEVARSLARRVAFLVGDPDRAQARRAAVLLAQRLATVVAIPPPAGASAIAQFGAVYFPYRQGLLADDDRRRLLAGAGAVLATRALSQVYGLAGVANAQRLRQDPFLLLPAFFAALPLPIGRLTLDDGVLTATDDRETWILVAGQLRGDPYALDVQRQLNTALADAGAAISAAAPRARILHTGAAFFAAAGAKATMAEMSAIGSLSTIGTVALVLLVFRGLTPLLLTVLAVGVGMAAGLSASLLWFGTPHILTMLLGVSLIGIAVDYSLYYCVEVFAPIRRTAHQRLMRVMPGISLGAITTAVGYATFLLAPFPGLREVAVFSAVGLIASFATVVFWLPLLDRRGPAHHGARMLAAAGLLWRFWEVPRLRPLRLAVLGGLACAALAGAVRITPLDDVRRMQSLAPDLVAAQARIQQLTGVTLGTQFFVVRAPDTEIALQREETLLDRLHALRQRGALRGYRTPASFVPSAARQHDNQMLVQARLDAPLLAGYLAQLGLTDGAPDRAADAAPDGVLTLAMAEQAGPLAGLLREMIIPGGPGAAQIVMLDGVTAADAVRAAAIGIPGVTFVDPATDFSRLLGRYRRRAVILIAVSAMLMLPVLALRYRWRRAARVMRPAVMTVVLVPLIKALAGAPFTFFDAMGLVLVLSIAVDYAVFCTEAHGPYKPVALLGVSMAMVSTMLSFGLLVRSDVAALHAVGSTMLLGVALAFLLAPMAGDAHEASNA
jgi:predicted exporter